jgi:hypothetical protein
LLVGARPKPPLAVVLASALTFRPIESVGTFVDVYTTGPDTAFGTGLLWEFVRDMQLDAGTYLGIQGDQPVATPFVGFSFRR